MKYKDDDLLIIFKVDHPYTVSSKHIINKVLDYGIEEDCFWYSVRRHKNENPVICYVPKEEITFIGYANCFYKNERTVK